MKFFADTRTKRNTALVVLVVWLFALASGVANACLLETPELFSKTAKGTAAASGSVPSELAGHTGASAGHHDDSDNSKESCLKVCDSGSHTLPSANSAVDHTDPGPATLVATLWSGLPPAISAPRRLDDLKIPIVGRPMRVHYSRLAL